MNNVTSIRTIKVTPSIRKIGYDNRTGAPEGVPYEFARLIVAFPDRRYGMWWYVHEDGTPSSPQGWYIWIESQRLLGITFVQELHWQFAKTLKTALPAAINKLLT